MAIQTQEQLLMQQAMAMQGGVEEAPPPGPGDTIDLAAFAGSA